MSLYLLDPPDMVKIKSEDRHMDITEWRYDGVAQVDDASFVHSLFFYVVCSSFGGRKPNFFLHC